MNPNGATRRHFGVELPWLWLGAGLACALLALLFHDALSVMVEWWAEKPEYSHGFILPLIAAFFVWQRSGELQSLAWRGSWAGVSIVILGLAAYVAGELSALYVIVQYAFLVVLAGLVMALIGWRAFKIVWAPFALLFFMIPLPNFLYQGLSGQAQLVSTEIGVAVMRVFGVSVFVEGNVIDLGTYKLQVAEACSGLRYLFPLTALGFIAAYVYRGEPWKRALIFLSAVPITILMNSLRIGAIGVLVEHWGVSMAEGFIHDFEGWVIFMACTGVLIFEMWLLARFGEHKRSLGEVFRLDLPMPRRPLAGGPGHAMTGPFIVGVSLLALVSVLSTALPTRAEASVKRRNFYEFPMSVQQWRGTPSRLDQVELDALKLDDYVMANFSSDGRRGVNFYVAFYASQRKGESAHSPRSCIPGGGWEITDLTQRTVDGVLAAGQPLRVNRVLIQKGDSRQLVYYWFQQRSRIITSEYLVKWYLFVDSITRNRTDGALVRLLTNVGANESVEQADLQLAGFARSVAPRLDDFVPR